MGKLLKLATMIEFDGSGTLTIRNGEARISLGSDGVVRVEGKRLSRRLVRISRSTLPILT